MKTGEVQFNAQLLCLQEKESIWSLKSHRRKKPLRREKKQFGEGIKKHEIKKGLS